MTIDAIRDNIYNELGCNVEIIHNEGRNRIYKYSGKIIEVYSNIFIVSDSYSRKSFSYYDILTNTIKISFKM